MTLYSQALALSEWLRDTPYEFDTIELRDATGIMMFRPYLLRKNAEAYSKAVVAELEKSGIFRAFRGVSKGTETVQ